MSVASDPRWQKFNDQGFQCSCGEKHVGLFAIPMEVPKGWPHARTYEPDAALRMDGDFLSANYCVREGKFFFLRCRLPIMIAGAEKWAFTYTVWASVDRSDFEDYVAAVKAENVDDKKTMRAQMANRLSGFPPTDGLGGTAYHRKESGWPVLVVAGLQAPGRINHPLMKEQQEGIGMDRVLELFAAYGHDMKAAAA